MILRIFVLASADLYPCLSHGYDNILLAVAFQHNAVEISVFFPVLLKQDMLQGLTDIRETL